METQLVNAILREIKSNLRKADATWENAQFGSDRFQDGFGEQVAEAHLIIAWDLMMTLLEKCDLKFLCQRASEEYGSFKKNPSHSLMGPEEPYLVWSWKIQEYADVAQIATIGDSEVKAGKHVGSLIKVLENCEKHIQDRRIFAWVPCSEDDVHGRIESVLECLYDGVLRKPPIAKPIKNFEPDTAVPSVKTLIEYKYITSDGDAKRVVDEILADIGGYQGEDYDTFVFVIYETQRFRRLTDWKDMVKRSNPPNQVEVILLKGIKPEQDDESLSAAHHSRIREAVTKAKESAKGGKTIAKRTCKKHIIKAVVPDRRADPSLPVESPSGHHRV